MAQFIDGWQPPVNNCFVNVGVGVDFNCFCIVCVVAVAVVSIVVDVCNILFLLR